MHIVKRTLNYLLIKFILTFLTNQRIINDKKQTKLNFVNFKTNLTKTNYILNSLTNIRTNILKKERMKVCLTLFSCLLA